MVAAIREEFISNSDNIDENGSDDNDNNNKINH